jgi:RES domain-containing protein
VYGGRWNSRGTAVVYLSEHESLAALELFVHTMPLPPTERYLSFQLEWEDKLTEYFPLKNLPTRWNAEPPTFETMQIGDEWIRRGKSVALAVPMITALPHTVTRFAFAPPSRQGISALDWTAAAIGASSFALSALRTVMTA